MRNLYLSLASQVLRLTAILGFHSQFIRDIEALGQKSVDAALALGDVVTDHEFAVDAHVVDGGKLRSLLFMYQMARVAHLLSYYTGIILLVKILHQRIVLQLGIFVRSATG